MAGLPSPPRAVSIVGSHGPEKTAFLGRLARCLAERGLRVAVLSWPLSAPLPDEAKDTGRYRRAGARLSALATPGWLILTHRLSDGASRPSLRAALELLTPWADGVLVDGEAGGLPRVLLALPGLPQAAAPLPEFWAVVGDPPPGWEGPVFSLQEAAQLAELLRRYWETA